MGNWPVMNLIACGLAAAGYFLLLTTKTTNKKQRYAAIALITVAVLGRIIPISGFDTLFAPLPTTAGTLLFVLPAGLPLLGLFLLLSGRNPTTGFLLIVTGNSALMLWCGSAALALLNFAICGTLWGGVFLAIKRETHKDPHPAEPSQKLLSGLTCAAGGLLLAVLVTALTASELSPSEAAAPGYTVSWSDIGRAILIDHGVSLIGVGLILGLAFVGIKKLGQPGEVAP